ncbi:hypothetical protein ACFLQR_00395 [Verrucomicrobiota bacterium]
MDNRLDLDAYDFDFAKNTLLPLYDKAYHFEVQQKNTINSRLNFPIAILTLVLGALTILLKDLPRTNDNTSCVIFFITFTTVIPSLISTLYFFAHSIFGYKYDYVKSTGTIDSIVRSLKTYNDKEENTKKRNIEKELIFFLLNQYKISADDNREANIRKSMYLRKTLISLFISGICLMVAVGAYFFGTVNVPEEIHKVQIINSKEEVIMFDDEDKPEKDEENITWPAEPDKIHEADAKPLRTKEGKSKSDKD